MLVAQRVVSALLDGAGTAYDGLFWTLLSVLRLIETTVRIRMAGHDTIGRMGRAEDSVIRVLSPVGIRCRGNRMAVVDGTAAVADIRITITRFVNVVAATVIAKQLVHRHPARMSHLRQSVEGTLGEMTETFTERAAGHETDEFARVRHIRLVQR